MKVRAMSIILAASLLAIPLHAEKKKKEVFLRAHPTGTQSFTTSVYYHSALENGLPPDTLNPETNIVDVKNHIRVQAKVKVTKDAGILSVLLLVRNDSSGPIEVGPERIAFIDWRGHTHWPLSESVAKSVIAERNHLAPFSPPPPETHYTITNVPIDSRAPVPPNASQPQFAISVTQVREEPDLSEAGYAIGYLLTAWLKERSARKEMEWVDRTWFHGRTLESDDFVVGQLFFTDMKNVINEMLAQKPKYEIVPPPANQQSPPMTEMMSEADNSIKLLIFAGDQQFVLEFGPDVLERKSK